VTGRVLNRWDDPNNLIRDVVTENAPPLRNAKHRCRPSGSADLVRRHKEVRTAPQAEESLASSSEEGRS
jgi:hypothetical protein